MNPYYFGDSKRPLYGTYYPPRAKRVRDTSVLLCYPMGQEYIRAHRAFQQLSSLLSKAGFHVFRFDYSSTGDSAGDSKEGNILQWKLDIRAAIQELQDASGVRNISLVGLRLGAALASLSTNGITVKDLVLWDPVVNGKSYINALVTMHQAMLTDPDRFHATRAQTVGEGTEELMGFPFPSALRAGIQEIDLLSSTNFVKERTYLIVSEEKDEYVQLREHLARIGVQVDYRLIASAGDWDKIGKLEDALTPHEILQTIPTLVGGRPA